MRLRVGEWRWQSRGWDRSQTKWEKKIEKHERPQRTDWVIIIFQMAAYVTSRQINLMLDIRPQIGLYHSNPGCFFLTGLFFNQSCSCGQFSGTELCYLVTTQGSPRTIDSGSLNNSQLHITDITDDGTDGLMNTVRGKHPSSQLRDDYFVQSCGQEFSIVKL